MNIKSLWISVIAVGLSFVGGFLLANALNRGELDIVKGENERLKNADAAEQKVAAEVTLSNDEIQNKIAEADRNPNNFQFQKNLGLALYRYASMKKDTKILAESLRLLVRANIINSGDRDVQVGLGNAYFDTGYQNKDNKSFASAREFYGKALAKTPADVEIITDLGLTYYLQEPPDLAMAVKQFEASLKIDAEHEKALEFLIQSLIKQNEAQKAGEFIERLRKANPDSQSLPQLSALVSQAGTDLVK